MARCTTITKSMCWTTARRLPLCPLTWPAAWEADTATATRRSPGHLLPAYMKNCELMFCPSDPAPQSRFLATNIQDYNGGIANLGGECSAAPNGEQCRAENDRTAMWSYLLNSIFTHKSCRYILEGALPGFATDPVIASLNDPNIIMFSERNSVALDAPDNSDYGYIPQDDYDTWPGECDLVRLGCSALQCRRPLRQPGLDQIRSAQRWRELHLLRRPRQVPAWGRARLDQFPDHRVRNPIPNSPG